MGSLTNFGENALLNHIVNTAYTPVATVYGALAIGDPGEAATGAAMNETANANGYVRTPITFGAAAVRRVLQSADVLFPVATGNYAAPITHWAIVDSATYGAGNALAYGALANARNIVTGNTPQILTALQECFVELQANAGSGLSDFSVHALLNLMFRNVAFTSPAGNTFVALSQTVLDDQDVAVADFTEITGTGSSRIEINPNGGASPTWTTVSGGVVSNADVINFATVGAGGWTDFVAMALVDTLSGAGNVLGYDSANIVDQTNILENDTVNFQVGGFTITVT